MPAFLPPEIWLRILSHAARDSDSDSCALWISARHVSRDWRSIIAQVYADTFLRDPARFSLRFDTDTSIDLEMLFHRYVPGDRSRCVFRFKEQNDVANVPTYMAECEKLEYVREKYSAVKRGIVRYIGDGERNRRFDLTPHIICCDKKYYMDSALSHLSFDSDKGETSFNWESTFDSFFHEVMTLTQRDLVAARRIGARFQEDPEFLEDYENIASLMDAVEGARLENLRRVRRRRIEAYYDGPQELDQQDAKWAVVEEKHRLHRLRAAHEVFGGHRTLDEDSDSDG